MHLRIAILCWMKMRAVIEVRSSVLFWTELTLLDKRDIVIQSVGNSKRMAKKANSQDKAVLSNARQTSERPSLCLKKAGDEHIMSNTDVLMLTD